MHVADSHHGVETTAEFAPQRVSTMIGCWAMRRKKSSITEPGTPADMSGHPGSPL